MDIGDRYHGLSLTGYCGWGAYGEVYVCEDISGREMAVKIVSKNKLGDDWERELRGVINYRKITENAPELLQIFHVEEDDETFFYTMEAADSITEDGYSPDTLAARLKSGPLPKTKLYPVLTAIFSGIKTIHDAGFAHRDIKPDNIIFVKGKPKLGDIGLLSSLSATHTQLAGTLDFLPPEERASGSSGTDRRSRQKNDLYAFGKVIYCSVTGCGPQDFPTVPAGLALTPELKFFLRLAFRLCGKDPLLRLDSLEKTEMELARIEHQIQYGETFLDKVRYAVHEVLTRLSGELLAFAYWSRKHWFFMVIAIIIAGPLILFLKPGKKFDIAGVKTRTYTNKILRFTITLPAEWSVLSAETVRQTVQERKNLVKGLSKDEIERRVRMIEQSMVGGACLIYCDYIEPPDNCLVEAADDYSLEEYRDRPDDVIEFQFREMFRKQLGDRAKVYEVKRFSVAGTQCIRVDASLNPGKARSIYHWILLPGRAIQFTLNVRQENYHQRMEEFSECLKTLKFGSATK